MTPPDAVPPDDTPPGRTPPAPPAVTAASLARPGLRHGFFTRRGGVSTGLHESLNCGRSCVRFTSFEQLPADAVRRIVQGTAREQQALARPART